MRSTATIRREALAPPEAAVRERPGWLTPLLVGVLLAMLTSLPYLYAHLTQPPGRVFMGFFFAGDDANTYLEKMREGWAGGWLWVNHYTTETSPPALYFTAWIALGHLAALTHLSLLATFQVARVTGAVALLLAAWMFICHFVAQPTARRFALFFLAFGFGFGWIMAAAHQPVILGLKSEALDWRMPELSAFYSILATPNFAWAAAFQAVGVVLTLRAVAQGRLGLGLLAGAAFLAEALIHAQMPVLMGGAMLAALLVRRPSLRGWAAFALAFAIPAPYAAYSYWASIHVREVVLWGLEWRNNLPPEVVSLTLSLLPQLLLAALALPGMLRRRSREDAFLLAWLVLLIAILWLPNPAANLRRRFFDGIYLALVVMAARGMYDVLVPRLRSVRARRLVPFTWVTLSATAGIVLLLAPFGLARQPQYSLPRPTYDALQWLGTQPAGIVLSSDRVGLYVPAYTPDTVYAGQYSETYQYFGKAVRAYRLLTGRDQDLQEFIAANHVRYVLWTDEFGGSPPSALGAPAFYEPGAEVFVVDAART